LQFKFVHIIILILEVEILKLSPTKSYTAWQMVQHRYFALALYLGDGHRKLVTRFGVLQRV